MNEGGKWTPPLHVRAVNLVLNRFAPERAIKNSWRVKKSQDVPLQRVNEYARNKFPFEIEVEGKTLKAEVAEVSVIPRNIKHTPKYTENIRINVKVGETEIYYDIKPEKGNRTYESFDDFKTRAKDNHSLVIWFDEINLIQKTQAGYETHLMLQRDISGISDTKA